MYAAPFPWARNLRLALPALVATTLAYVASYELRTIDGEISPIWLANAALQDAGSATRCWPAERLAISSPDYWLAMV
jgi:hypothetical protein